MKYACGVLILSALAWAQDTPERVTVPLSDASRPKTVKVTLMNGGITVKGYAGKEVVVEARPRAESEGRGRRERRERPDPKAQGLKRLDDNSNGLTVEEQDNVVTIGTGVHGMSRNMELDIQVPFDTSLRLKTMNGGDIVVDHVNAEIDANDMNGAVTITNVSGAVVAHSMNGAVTATIDKVTPDKPMSFSSMNGDIDVTLPADTRANLKLKTEYGEIYSDFEIQLAPSANQPKVTDNRKGGGRYQVKFDKGLSGTINGGGPEMQLTTFNGKIYLRKKK